MTIETKFKSGDRAWCIFDNKVCELTIKWIRISVFVDNNVGITCITIDGFELNESELFPSKQDLLNSL